MPPDLPIILPILGKKLWKDMTSYVGAAMKKAQKSRDIRACEAIRFSKAVILTMKPTL